ncbi:M23 family metallopeptidase [Maribacter sp. 2304DJ31-5]|uniref:M23 family metallopeptidase n=1 Tax=Maribacter sp. 2304DJ31-5 TaxID=3386273 RepID=UPI0039BCEC40
MSHFQGNAHYQFGYWHLSEVATNPDTGKPYTNGDIVRQGDIVGYTGSTGNANSKDSARPHLHLRGRKNGQKYDPIKSFQSEIDLETGKGTPFN